MGGLIDYAVYSLFVVMARPEKLTPLLAVATGSAVALSVNFLSAKFWVFRRR